MTDENTLFEYTEKLKKMQETYKLLFYVCMVIFGSFLFLMSWASLMSDLLLVIYFGICDIMTLMILLGLARMIE